MKKSTGIEQIREFVDRTTQDYFGDFDNDKNIHLARKFLEEYGISTYEDFTFTIGELNAYMG